MGQAKRRGTREERIAQAQAREAAKREEHMRFQVAHPSMAGKSRLGSLMALVAATLSRR